MTAVLEVESKTTVNGKPRINPMWFQDLMGGEWAKLGKYWVGLVKFSPEVAALVLDNHNKENRRPVQTQISVLSRDIGSGNFQVTLETIIFNTNRNLVNGQNRLYACVNSGSTFTTLVAVGADPSVFQVLDQHSKRQAGQVLQMMGEVNCNELAAAIFALNKFLLTGDVRPRGSGHGEKWRTMSIPERLEVLSHHEGLREHIHYFRANQKSFKLFPSSSTFAAMRYLFDFAHRNHCVKFWDSLKDMAIPDEPRCNATRLLLKRLVAMRDELEVPRDLIRRVAAITIKAWNSWVDNAPLDRLQWQDNKEEFPKISGLKYIDGQIIL